MTLPNDVARCPGSGSEEDGWREGCDDCARRLAYRDGQTWGIDPPEIIVFECEFRIPMKLTLGPNAELSRPAKRSFGGSA